MLTDNLTLGCKPSCTYNLGIEDGHVNISGIWNSKTPPGNSVSIEITGWNNLATGVSGGFDIFTAFNDSGDVLYVID